MYRTLAAVILAILAFGVVYFDFLGIPTKASLHIIAMHVQVDDEIEALADEIRSECSGFENQSDSDSCYVNQVWLHTPSNHTLAPTPPKPIQLPSETYRLGHGNCVDRAVFQASLLKALGFDDVYLAVQIRSMMPLNGHVYASADGSMEEHGKLNGMPIKNFLEL